MRVPFTYTPLLILRLSESLLACSSCNQGNSGMEPPLLSQPTGGEAGAPPQGLPASALGAEAEAGGRAEAEGRKKCAAVRGAGGAAAREQNRHDFDFNTSQTVQLGEDLWEFTGGVLGRGAFGVVLDARSTSRDHRAAVKIVDTRSMSAWQARQSESEISLWSTLNHPNIVRFLGHARLSHWMLLFSEPLDGGELMDHIMQCSVFVEADAAGIVRQLLSAVAHMHELRICHRDIKPQNVVCAERPELAGGEWRVKLCDFGHAKSLDVAPDAELHTPCGSHQYAAPEVTRSVHDMRPSYSLAVDMWSVGCILHLLLSGEMPPKAAPPLCATRAWSCVSPAAQDLQRQLMQLRPSDRPTAAQAVEHPALTSAPKTPLETPRLCRQHPPRVVAHAWWSERVAPPATAPTVAALSATALAAARGRPHSASAWSTLAREPQQFVPAGLAPSAAAPRVERPAPSAPRPVPLGADDLSNASRQPSSPGRLGASACLIRHLGGHLAGSAACPAARATLPEANATHDGAAGRPGRAAGDRIAAAHSTSTLDGAVVSTAANELSTETALAPPPSRRFPASDADSFSCPELCPGSSCSTTTCSTLTAGSQRSPTPTLTHLELSEHAAVPGEGLKRRRGAQGCWDSPASSSARPRAGASASLR